VNILKISIITAVIGIITLFLLTQVFKEKTVKIEDLKIGQIERISGMITSAYVSKNMHVFLKVADNTGEISVVIFENYNIDEAYDLEVGDEVSILGRVDEYKGETELIAKEIKKL
jgi:exonuclease VII large subunit